LKTVLVVLAAFKKKSTISDNEKSKTLANVSFMDEDRRGPVPRASLVALIPFSHLPAIFRSASKKTKMATFLCLLLNFVILSLAAQRKVVYQGTPNDSSLSIAWKNGALFNVTLNALKPGDLFIVPNTTYHVMGGIQVANLSDVVIQIDGTLVFTKEIDDWPADASGVTSFLLLSFFSLFLPIIRVPTFSRPQSFQFDNHSNGILHFFSFLPPSFTPSYLLSPLPSSYLLFPSPFLLPTTYRMQATSMNASNSTTSRTSLLLPPAKAPSTATEPSGGASLASVTSSAGKTARDS
jgi:hypothetical protein